MVLEIAGMIVVLAAWIYDMDVRLKEKQRDRRLIIVYLIGFVILAAASSGTMTYAFFFLLLGLVTLMEFTFVIVKNR